MNQFITDMKWRPEGRGGKFAGPTMRLLLEQYCVDHGTRLESVSPRLAKQVVEFCRLFSRPGFLPHQYEEDNKDDDVPPPQHHVDHSYCQKVYYDFYQCKIKWNILQDFTEHS